MRLLAIFIAALALAPGAQAAGYSYATLTTPSHRAGLAANLTLAAEPRLGQNSHTASWVGVGTSHDWVQVGIVADLGLAPRLYFEVANGPYHRFVTLRDVRVDETVRVGIYEVSPARWIVISPAGIVGPFKVPGSHTWQPQVATESYESGSHDRVSYTIGQIESPQASGRWAPTRELFVTADPGWSIFGLAPGLFGAKLS